MTRETPGGALRAVVDRDECFGFGNCVDTLTSVFVLGGDGISIARDLDADPGLLTAAVDGCPRGAISLIRRDEGGGTRHEQERGSR